MVFFSIFFSLLLAVAGVHAQDECETQVTNTVVAEIAAMNAFINQTPPPTSTNETDCHSAAVLQAEITLTGQAVIAQGCEDIYNHDIVTNEDFVTGSQFLADFLQLC
ncbi:hypothetical protein MSAN_02272700 [Mycena sanguinolenta]|uniref:Uncharacterized protein n=1 Tax=Mycena sanguinolenta TaxID=230812 RepID=A0A8H6XB12_9AGAR|nr:hypothetical protein MSAN_02272700 [Mycena sanguinolenta]